MTAREVIMDGNEGYRFKDVIDNLTEDCILDCMKEYARLKCEELLEIVADNVYAQVEYDWNASYVDRDSILNAVDLNEFIK